MEPRAACIRDIALWDPIAAYGIVMGAIRAPIAMNVPAIFNSFATSQIPVEGDLDTTIAQRTWIHRIDYSIQVPHVFEGNVFKSLSDAMLRLGSPGISVRVSVYGGPKYMPAPNFTPIENFTNVIADTWPAGWPLFTNNSIKVEYQLTQSPPATAPNGPPLIVVTTFTGWQFLDPTISEMDPMDARNRLAKMGIQTIDPPVRP